MKVIDKRTGAVVEVPDQEVQAGFQSGAYALPKGALVPIQRADGDIGTVPAEGLSAELDAGGSILPQEDFNRIQAQAKYGGAGGMAEAAAAGVARGATLGLSDVAIKSAGGEKARAALQGLKEANPYVSGAGELGGALLPAIATEGGTAEASAAELGAEGVGAGEAALAAGREAPAVTDAALSLGTREASGTAGTTLGDVARGTFNAATAPARLTGDAGRLAERAIGAVIGDNSPSLLARTAQRAIASAGAGGVEGALYGVGDQISEDTLGDKDITAQKLFAAAGHGALFGAVAGGALGGAGELGISAAKRIGSSEALQKLSETQAWRALNPNKPITREVDKYVAGGHRGIGRQLLDDGVLEAGDTIDELAPKVKAGLDNAVSEQNALLQDLQSRGAKGVELDSLLKRIDDRTPQIIKELGEAAGPVRTAIDNTTKRLALLADMSGGVDHGLIPLDKLNSFRRLLDDEIHYEQALSYTKVESPATRMLKSIRAEVEDSFTKQADREMSRLQGTGLGDWEKSYKAAKLKTQRYIEANKAAQQAFSAKYANQAASLTDKAAGLSFGTMGGNRVLYGAAGTAVKHGILAGVTHGLGHAALGLGATFASKFIRERGNSTVAVLLRKAKDLSAVAQVTKRFDARMASEVEKALRGTPYRGKSIDLGRYDSVVKRVTAAQSQLTHDQAMGSHLGTIQETAPKVSSAFGATVRRATILLANKIPQQPTYRPLADLPPATDAQKAELLRAERAIEDPMVLFKDIRSGTLTQDTIDTIKKVHPQLFAQMQAEVSKQINTDKTIPYGQKILMARLFGMDLDGTTDPQFVQAMQQNLIAAQQPKPAGGGKGGGHPRKASFKSKLPQSMTLQSRIAQPMSVDL